MAVQNQWVVGIKRKFQFISSKKDNLENLYFSLTTFTLFSFLSVLVSP